MLPLIVNYKYEIQAKCATLLFCLAFRIEFLGHVGVSMVTSAIPEVSV